ncbi:hypothetical protein YC2023_002661 [Brassica napus]
MDFDKCFNKDRTGLYCSERAILHSSESSPSFLLGKLVDNPSRIMFITLRYTCTTIKMYELIVKIDTYFSSIFHSNLVEAFQLTLEEVVER